MVCFPLVSPISVTIYRINFRCFICLEGENIIYVGKGKWWGHLRVNPLYETLDGWVARTGGWANLTKEQALAKKADIVDEKRGVPALGLSK